MTIVFHSFDAFGRLSRGQLFMMDALRWTPVSFATWIFETDQRPGMARLRENRAYGREVAGKLIEEKKQGLKDGASRNDIMTLLGSSRAALTRLLMFGTIFNPSVKVNSSQRPDLRLDDEEIIAQVR